MRQGANDEEQAGFVHAIERAIDDAPEQELTPEARVAVRDILQSAFDGAPVRRLYER